MLEGVRSAVSFADRYSAVCDMLGYRPELETPFRRNAVDGNAAGSALTVLVSSISLDLYRSAHGPVSFLAGYSVGQWTALYAAGCLSFEDLLHVIKQRADCMDACFREASGGMMAVIGIAPDPLEAFCARLRSEGLPIFISNFNAYGQYSLSGTSAAIDAACERVRELAPKRVVRLPVSGAWHCPLVAGAEAPFSDFLRTVPIQRPAATVIDNVSGLPFVWEPDWVRSDLARHLSRPVLWDEGIRQLVRRGCRRFVEVGFGTMLTKFGFFIDRTVSHVSFYAA